MLNSKKKMYVLVVTWLSVGIPLVSSFATASHTNEQGGFSHLPLQSSALSLQPSSSLQPASAGERTEHLALQTAPDSAKIGYSGYVLGGALQGPHDTTTPSMYKQPLEEKKGYWDRRLEGVKGVAKQVKEVFGKEVEQTQKETVDEIVAYVKDPLRKYILNPIRESILKLLESN